MNTKKACYFKEDDHSIAGVFLDGWDKQLRSILLTIILSALHPLCATS